MIIRKEENRDLEAITRVTIAAFENHPISRPFWFLNHKTLFNKGF
jgi:hypothetical protein